MKNERLLYTAVAIVLVIAIGACFVLHFSSTVPTSTTTTTTIPQQIPTAPSLLLNQTSLSRILGASGSYSSQITSAYIRINNNNTPMDIATALFNFSAPTTGKSIEAILYPTSNARYSSSAWYNSTIRIFKNYTGASSIQATASGTINGMTYTLFTISIGGGSGLHLIGYKGDLLISMDVVGLPPYTNNATKNNLITAVAQVS